MFPSLARAARDAALAIGRNVRWEQSDGAIRLDAQVLVVIHDAMLHLVRNAIAHGIEAEEVRIAAGKPPAGVLEIRVERRGNRVAFICRDDGAGFDLREIGRAAVAKQIVSAADAASLTLPGAIDLVLHRGVSTSDIVTGMSGRGIGLDVVRHAAELLKGELRVDSTPARGSTVEIVVPVSMTSIAVLMVEAGGLVASIPVDAVRCALTVGEHDIARSGAGESVAFEGHPIPFAALSHILTLRSARLGEGRLQPVVVVTSDSRLAAVGVDRLLGTATVLVRSIPPLALVDPVVAGASLDAEGSPQLVLDPNGLVLAAEHVHVETATHDQAPTPAHLDRRRFADHPHGGAGHPRVGRTSGRTGDLGGRGARKGQRPAVQPVPGRRRDARHRRIRVHCPNAAPIRGLREIPSILVTSRRSAEDMRRGQEVGSRAYIVKGEFNQESFLRRSRGW